MYRPGFRAWLSSPACWREYFLVFSHKKQAGEDFCLFFVLKLGWRGFLYATMPKKLAGESFVSTDEG